jgi:putative ABC transport system ATP-binding protein
MSLIKLENVWKIYQLGKVKLAALQGINLEIEAGSFLAIMGPSGSGKSTLLNLIGCLDIPTQGKVFLEEKEISQLSENELTQIRGKKIGFIFQQFNLLANLNSLENVILPMIFQGISEKERVKKAKELLSLVGMEKRLFHKPNELSVGEQQRVAIARALANDPKIIVADEPTGNLDSKTGQKIMEILKELNQNQKKTIIVVTHDPNVAKYSQKVVNIRDGQIVK